MKRPQFIYNLIVAAALFTLACTVSHPQTAPQAAAQELHTVDLLLPATVPFKFVAYGDSRFHNPSDTDAANPSARQTLVQAIARENPAFVAFSGDIVYNGYDKDDWKVYDSETAVWKAAKIPVYPSLGNHDLHGDPKLALGNYFDRFPDLKESRYYSVRAANALLLVLDSSLDETSGPQGEWLNQKLDSLPPDVHFIFLLFHHPPYTSSSDDKKYGGGHASRPQEHELARMLETRQQMLRARIVVFSGHVHNYERHEHGGVTYFVTGGAGAHAYPIERAPDDPFQSKQINYHYLLVEVRSNSVAVTMNRVDLASGTALWTRPDSVTIVLPAAKAAAASR